MVVDQGSPAGISCHSCLVTQRPCIVSALSRRCSSCLFRAQGCSLARQTLCPLPDPLLDEIHLREEISSLIEQLAARLRRLEALTGGSVGS